MRLLPELRSLPDGQTKRRDAPFIRASRRIVQNPYFFLSRWWKHALIHSNLPENHRQESFRADESCFS